MPAPILTDISNKLLDMGVAIVGIKLGASGLYLRTAKARRLERMGRASPKDLATWSERELWSPVFQVEVKGTVGAGDTTYAGFLSSLLHQLVPEEALTMACAVGGFSVEAPDAVSSIKSWSETLARVQNGWARASSKPDPGEWEALSSGVFSKVL
jgi:sugar/nucleoside kinase (ribokinase family)